MNRIITNWENDMIDAAEPMVSKFVSKHYPNLDFKLLSGLRHRDIQDIRDSLMESRIIIMQPSLLEEEQVVNIVTSISHPIHVANNGARRDWEIRDFIFLSMNPFEDLMNIREMCGNKKDHTGELALHKILFNCECHFFGFDDEHYEMKYNRGHDIYAIRYK
jgi:hypothetical protein